MQSLPFESGDPKWWKSSYQQIESELRQGRWNHCAVSRRNCNFMAARGKGSTSKDC
jgi:hypothetical protein